MVQRGTHSEALSHQDVPLSVFTDHLVAFIALNCKSIGEPRK